MLSIVVPFFRKDLEFNHVFPLYNLGVLNQFTDVELLLIIDDPTHYQMAIESLKNLVQQERVNFSIKVFLNDETHPWRSPCKAINVGIYHAKHDKILVVSPETILMQDSIQKLFNACTPDSFSIGIIKFIKLSIPFAFQSVEQLLLSVQSSRFTPYGSIMFTKQQADKIGGYDEEFKKWGGDDDDFRTRLKRAGYKQNVTLAKFLHLNLARDDLNASQTKRKELNSETMVAKINAIQEREGYRVNNGIYGRSYNRVIFEYQAEKSPVSQPCLE